MIFFAVATTTAIFLYFYRRVAIRFQWFDVPNARSSHRGLVPRGAGIVFVVTILAGFLAVRSAFGDGFFWPSLLLGCVVAAAGWWDDVKRLSSRARFVVYATVSLVSVVAAIDGLSFGWFKMAVILIAAVSLLWWINLYNFMDGINGIATLEAIFLASAFILLRATGAQVQELAACKILVAGLIGFLLWNFPRARLFMGDAGSAFLGYVLGVVALWSIISGTMTLWQWLLLAGVFLVDATYTLAVRILTGQRWHQAHRSHAYQRLSDRCGSHTTAVAVLMSINVGWLLPWAYSMPTLAIPGLLGVLFAYAPLVLGCYVLRAGCLAEHKQKFF